MRAALLVVVGLAGCGSCVGSVEADTDAVEPGAEVALRLVWRGEVLYGPGACGGYWAVDGVEGGDPAVGTIDDCGRYTAPVVPPDHDPEVLAAEFPPGQCSDCCPHGTWTVPLVRP